MPDVALAPLNERTDTPTHRGALTGVWVGVAMVVVIPAALIHFTPSPTDHSWLGTLLIAMLSGSRYAWIVGDGRRRLVEMSFWVFTYVFLGIAATVQIRTGVYPVTTPRVDPALNGPATILVLVGLAAFTLGLMVPATSSRRARTPVRINERRTIFLAFVALAANGYYVAKLGVGVLFANRLDRDNTEQTVWPDSATFGIIAALASMSIVVAFVALVKHLQQSTTPSRPMIVLTIIVGGTLAMTINPISSARYIFGTAALAALAAFGMFATRRRFRIVSILAVVALIVVFPLADAFRYTSNADFKATDTLSALSSADFDAFEQINNTILYVDRHGSTHGRQALGVVLFAVPRRIWPGKANDTGALIAESRHYENLNMSAPFWSELYINGLWIALVAGMFALGALAKIADTRIEESLLRSRSPAMLACVLPFYLLIVLRGSLLQAMSYLTVIVVCSLFVTDLRKRPDGTE
ncbi:hypothetical protein ABIA30_001932 [Mycobacterium sp. MAA66]|uniref:oligosaccharide repeat unit polymerase n=1 Tax=Mycobacterium sp. MAA66 TaxID=3156297 RepID=UPI0035159D77